MLRPVRFYPGRMNIDNRRSLCRILACAAAALAVTAGVLAAAPATAADVQTKTVSVAAAADSVSSGLTVRAGDTIRVSATGIGAFWYMSSLANASCDGAGGTENSGYTRPDGRRVAANNGTCSPWYGRSSSSFQLPNAPAGLLIGRIGDGPWFAVGADYTAVATATGPLQLAYNDLNRVDNSGGYTAVVALTPRPAATIAVPLTSEGVGTGFGLVAGDRVEIAATGSGHYGTEGEPCAGKPTVDVAGSRQVDGAACETKFDAWVPLPSAPVGALIGRIGSGGWFLVGAGTTVTADGTGELVLRVNDTFVPDNEGVYTATVSR